MTFPNRKGAGETLRFLRLGKQGGAKLRPPETEGFWRVSPKHGEAERWHEVPERASD